MKQAYRSIFFNDDWALPKYYGWSQLALAPDLKVLSKCFGPLRRRLLLSQGHSQAEIASALEKTGSLDHRTEVYLHLFDADEDEALTICGRRFSRALDNRRILNVATFVVDLARSEDELWKNLGAKGRNAARKPVEGGATVSIAASPDAALDAFYRLYASIARSANLQTPPRALIEKMMFGGNMISAACRNGVGEIEAVNLIYLSGNVGFYMFGATCAAPGVGVGQFTQWETIKYLRGAGQQFYDLGGVSSLDPGDGIFRFKKSLGGSLVQLGAEYVFCPKIVAASHVARSLARSLRAR